jgi:hypothetical protein
MVSMPLSTRHIDVTIWLDSWQLGPNHQMVTLDELLHLDQVVGVEEWPRVSPSRTTSPSALAATKWEPPEERCSPAGLVLLPFD